MSEPLDRSRLAELLWGSKQSQAAFLADFRRATDTDVELLQEAAATGDLAQVGELAHRMEGAAMVIGAGPVADACHAIGEAAGSGQPRTLGPALAALLQSRHALYARIDALFPAVPLPDHDGARPRVCEGLAFLVVEDQEFQRGVIMRLLRQLGALEVRGFADGTSALAAARESATPAVMMLDLGMPALNGMDVVRIVALERLPLAVIFISAVSDHLLGGPVLTARSSGATVLGAISKPLTAAKLAPLLAQHGHEQRRAAPKASSSASSAAGRVPQISELPCAVPAAGRGDS